MIALAEMTTWSAQDVQGAILSDLPSGWQFSAKIVNGWHVAKFVDDADLVVWEEQSADQRLLFFTAYGWLHLRGHKPKIPAWKLRTGEVNPSQTIVGRASSHVEVPDPEDLDPAEVAAVYADPHSRRR
jgi:hypothetical protein